MQCDFNNNPFSNIAMVTKDVLAKFLKLASNRIISGLDTNKWSGEIREAAITVLKNRGKDVSKYLEDTPSLQPASSEKMQELSDLVTSVLSKDDKSLIDKVYSIIGDVEDISKLPAETVDYAITSIKEWVKQAKTDKAIAEKKQLRRSTGVDKRVKDQVLDDEKKAIVDKIMADKSLTKKQKVIQMWGNGLTRTDTLALHFMDATYIYDLYREYSKHE